MEDDWDRFWKKRNAPLTPKIEMAFKSNFAAMHAIMLMHWWGTELGPMKSLEIGCGRAIISDYLEKIGLDTTTMDIIMRHENRHIFMYSDVLVSSWPVYNRYDLIVSYGLLEHFRYIDQSRIINNCVKYLVPGGIQIHYIVPKKITNLLEDRSVYRDWCFDLMDEYDVTWTYPIIGEQWVTNKWLGKGFIIYKVKDDENFSPCYGKVTKH
jgi:hypothetical protein